MLKKIMFTLGSVVALLIVGFGGLVLLTYMQQPTTTGEKTLVGYCKQFGPAKTLSDCQCVLDGARETLSEEDMLVAWQMYAEVGVDTWRNNEADRRVAEFTAQSNRPPSYEEERAIKREVRLAGRELYKRLKPVVSEIVSDCGFGDG